MSVSEAEITPSRVLQRYYPWIVIAIAFLTVGVAFGARNAFAVFLGAVIEEFRWSRGLASGALMPRFCRMDTRRSGHRDIA